MSNQRNSTTVPAVSTVSITVVRHNLEIMPMKELHVFMAAIAGARDAVNGVENQPRCIGKAYEEVNELQNQLNDVIEMVVDVARAAKPTSKDEAVIRAVLIMHHETEFHDGFETIEDCFLGLKADMAQFQEA